MNTEERDSREPVEERDDAKDQADAQMRSVRDMVTALELDWDRLEELREERDGYDDNGVTEGPTLWAQDNPDDAEELSQLEEQTNNCSDREDAERAIQEDALSVEVRSGWTNAGETMSAEDFRIVLCTGGPHVQIVGDLDEQGTPTRAWLEYNGWFQSMRERVNQEGDQEALLTYAGQFYFGG